MSWWGKIAGGVFGYMVGGVLGAILGIALGHAFDRGITGLDSPRGGHRARVQAAFFQATFAVMGHVAKADGRVSKDEISHAESVMRQMHLNQAQRQEAMRRFNEGKQPDFDLESVLQRFRRECRRRTTLVQVFIEIQLQAAYADGHMDPATERVLLHVCQMLGIPEERFRLLERMLRGGHHSRQRGAHTGGRGAFVDRDGMSVDDAYAVLGVSRDAGDDEIKKAYRKLMSEHHPDKLLAKGLPDEMVEVAKSKSQDIGRAYERIKEARGI
ncbi:MAG: co-chaperone DjlA [Halofilum sp. (in: g-proteobacteria)]